MFATVLRVYFFCSDLIGFLYGFNYLIFCNIQFLFLKVNKDFDHSFICTSRCLLEESFGRLL